MDKYIHANEQLLDTINTAKNRLLDVNLAHGSTVDNITIAAEIMGLDGVDDKTKELLILLYTNSVTANKLSAEVMVKTNNDVLNLVAAVIHNNNKVLSHIKPKPKPGIKPKVASFLNKYKPTAIVSGVLSIVVLVMLYIIYPEPTDHILDKVLTIFNRSK